MCIELTLTGQIIACLARIFIAALSSLDTVLFTEMPHWGPSTTIRSGHQDWKSHMFLNGMLRVVYVVLNLKWFRSIALLKPALGKGGFKIDLPGEKSLRRAALGTSADVWEPKTKFLRRSSRRFGTSLLVEMQTRFDKDAFVGPFSIILVDLGTFCWSFHVQVVCTLMINASSLYLNFLPAIGW